MSAIKTAGDLRGFLADVLIGIRQGTIGVEEAKAIAGVSAQINQSLTVEVKTALELQRMGKDAQVAGSMLIGIAPELPPPAIVPHAQPRPLADGGGLWCEQCEMRVTPEVAASCKSKHCKVRPDA